MNGMDTRRQNIIRLVAIGLIVLVAAGIYIYKNQTPAPRDAELGEQLDESLPTLLEFSSSTCPPCRKMLPILEELQGEYKGKVNIRIMDVGEYPEEAQQYSVKVVPTQIFLDVEGKQIARHEGFIPKEMLVQIFEEKMGVD